jgi:hypothetical protein
MPDERIAKLPKWAKAYIQKLERRVTVAEDTLSNYVDDQSPSEMWFEAREYSRETRKYVQTKRITIEHADVALDVSIHENDQIFLSWRPGGSDIAMGDICFIPSAYQQARLVNPKNACLAP